ncbi:GIY-YIG nuclease family protein [Metabacillus fastidiosus]|uniref:GIY-YIG nuclease family protein n=1 Tax=Metabacillus fastidiosus TaxID=1458 RepID=UPI002DBF851B|nr:GIY-YIG nuclease family protein [Metabacillus fastidiosus]MEC2076578.1 GIY-YIG nuclease family protein [Metabacillus fastidiosus]
MEKNNHFFYVLECKDGSYYAGYTVDLAARVEKHNAGKGAKYTRARKPVKLLYNERFETKSEALKMEYSFKKLSRIEKEKYIRKNGKEGLHNE